MFAQGRGSLPSVDGQTDSLAFLEMRNRMETIRKERPTVALVLGGGGALGAAHIGVIKYLEELEVPVDMVVGTSIGGLVGGMYSLGYSGEQIDSLFRSIDWGSLMSDTVPASLYSKDKRKRVEKFCLSIPYHYEEKDWALRQSSGPEGTEKQRFISSLSEGYLYGFNIINLFNSKSVGFHDDMRLLDLPTPFVCTSTELATGRSKNWTEGSVVDALRATMSIPFAFMPVRKEDKVFVDGGVRNNFPVDIARAMGADIVIGVDLHLPSTLEEASSTPQLVYMTATRPGADQVYEANIQDADVLMEPDMSDYNLLSFNKKAISVLIARGYETALGSKDSLEVIAQRTGRAGRRLLTSKAMDISNEPVKIDSIRIIGLTEEEQSLFMPRLGLKSGEYYSAKYLDRAVARIYGTGAFSRATYKLEGRSEPYDCEIICEKGPVNEFLLGLRADSEGLLCASIGLGIGTNRTRGNKLLLNGTLGKSSSIQADWKYAPLRGPAFNAYLGASYSDFRFAGSSSAGEGAVCRGESLHNEAAFFISDNSCSNLEVNLGVKADNLPIIREYMPSPRIAGDWKSFWSYAFMLASWNSLDNKYFPEHGLHVSLRCDYLLGGYTRAVGTKLPQETIASMDLTVPVPLTGRFTIIPYTYARIVSSPAGESSCYAMGNFIGGAMRGRYFEHQIPFIGYNGVKHAGQHLGMVGLDFRFKATPKGYISIIGQAYNDCVGHEDWTDQNVYACALQYSIRTMLGPVSANVHWSSDIHDVGVYASLGLDL